MRRLDRATVQRFLRSALREDGAFRDLTSRAVIPAASRVRARIVARAPGVLAGARVAAWTFTAFDPSLTCRVLRRDGATLKRGEAVLTVDGNARSVFSAERSALNLLAHLCGIATITRRFVRRAGHRPVDILDTRKTVPGLRELEKYAVRSGGGRNHRMGLHDAVLIKTNQIHALAGIIRRQGRAAAIHEAVASAKRLRPRRFVEIEVTNIREFEAALAAAPDAILLDNWRVPGIRRAMRRRRMLLGSRARTKAIPLLEASGGVTLANVRAIAQTGVERISVGRLTRSAPSLDVALEVIGPPR